MNGLNIFAAGCFAFLLLFGCLSVVSIQDFNGIKPPQFYDTGNNTNEQPEPKKFSSVEELQTYLRENDNVGYQYSNDAVLTSGIFLQLSGAAHMQAQRSAESAPDYSTTNIQVAGVDEADFAKNDGKYIYVISKDKLLIIAAYPPEKAGVVSKIPVIGKPREIFVNENTLVVFSERVPVYKDRWPVPLNAVAAIGRTVASVMSEEIMPRPTESRSIILQYDISDRANPKLERTFESEGIYKSSRMIGSYVYAIYSRQVFDSNRNIIVPEFAASASNGAALPVKSSGVYYFDLPAYAYQFTTIVSINLLDGNKTESKTYLTDYSGSLYVSNSNIYLTQNGKPELLDDDGTDSGSTDTPVWSRQGRQTTSINKIAINNGSIRYVAGATVPGTVLNQFSMDEYNGSFRIATTADSYALSGGLREFRQENNVYVLDQNMGIVGRLEALAPGEKIYSARFIGSRAYLVTFKKVDPLFVIDLSKPEKPKVLGKLKIPGYSDYLHPYDEAHLIGLGKDAIPSEKGDFAWYQGIKLSLFDVSDVSKPREIAKYNIGDRGTESYALHDHRAFMFSRQKDLLVIPVLLAEHDGSKYAGERELWHSGEYTFQGAYVFNLTKEGGFDLSGRITHIDDSELLLKSGYYFNSEYAVKRSLYIGEALYTVSDEKIMINDLHGLEKLKQIELH